MRSRPAARADFPGGSAGRLWRSIQQILEPPEATRLFTGHDGLHGPAERRAARDDEGKSGGDDSYAQMAICETLQRHGIYSKIETPRGHRTQEFFGESERRAPTPLASSLSRPFRRASSAIGEAKHGDTCG